MTKHNIPSKNVVVTRPIIQHKTPVYYEDDVLTSIYFIPRLPFSIPNTQWFLGVIEFIIISCAIFVGITVILLFKHSQSKYKCPKCGESFCFDNTTPTNCKKCGHPLAK